jgi:hypothetical protein
MTTRKPSQTETPTTKQRGYRFWLPRITLLLGLPLVFYCGYCWGLWGRNSLLLQYLFQCGCPVVSSELRYPNAVDVVVPACKYLESLHSPSGRLIYVLAEGSGTTSTYLLNIETGEKILFTLPDEGSSYFLTDDLVFHSFYGDDEYILDIPTGIKHSIQDAKQLEPSIYSMGNIAPHLLLDALSTADQIFLIKDVFQPVVVLSSDFRNHPEHSFTFNALDFSADETNPVEGFMREYDVPYLYIPGRYPGELISPDGRFIARADGIYLTTIEEKIIEGYSGPGGKYFAVRGWAYDNSGALYSKSIIHWPCLIEGPTISDVPLCIFKVPQPLLLLKIPEEYITSTQTP